MSVQPEEKLESILDRCMNYWLLKGDKDRYVFLRRNDKIGIDETVISAGIEGGDVLRVVDKSSMMPPEKEKKVPEKLKKDPAILAEEWLEKNIGIDSDELGYVAREEGEEGIDLIFQIKGKEGSLTVQVKDGKVSNYIPIDITSDKE